MIESVKLNPFDGASLLGERLDQQEHFELNSQPRGVKKQGKRGMIERSSGSEKRKETFCRTRKDFKISFQRND